MREVLLRVAFIISHTPLYGANQSLLGMIEGLKKYGIKSHVLAPGKGPITERLIQKEIPYAVFPYKRWMSRNRWKAPARLGVNIAILPFLIKQLRNWQIELIYSNNSVIPVGAFLAELLSLPHVWHIREFGDIGLNLSYDWGKRFFSMWMKRANARIAVSEAVRDHVLRGSERYCHVIHNGIISEKELEELINGKYLKKTDKKSSYTFAIVGRLQPAKGQEQAIQAIYKLSQNGHKARLLIAGEGQSDYLQFLQQLSQSLAVNDKLSFLGHVSKPFEIYTSVDAILMCSAHEAFGRVTMEAMAAGKPVIGLSSGATPELIEHEANGLLYDGTIEGLTDCMQKCLTAPDKSRMMGANGRDKVQQGYTNEIYAGKIYNVLQNIMF